MILFQKIRWKNLLSTGNVFTELDLTKEKTTLISGANGAGKSTFLDAITFALYGKPFRKINKPQLVSSINQRDCLVEVEFKIGSARYLIRRGIKPTIFEIFKNDELINQDAATRDYQEYLVENILKINFKAFTQIVILGSATYVPFMQLPAHARREVIEDLLDIQVFSTMNLLLKDRVDTNKEEITDSKHAIELIKGKIEAAEKHNESIRRIRVADANKIKERVGKILEEIDAEKEQINDAQEQVDSLLSLIGDKAKVYEKAEKLRQVRADLNARKRVLTETLSFYHDNDECPTCKQGIEHKEETIATNQTALDEVANGLSQLAALLATSETRLSEIANTEAELQRHNNRIGQLNSGIRMKMQSLKQLKADLQNAEKEMKEVDISEILEYNKNLTEANDKYAAALDDRETLTVTGAMLKDGGIKTRIIRQYVPIMNSLINKYLAAFDMFVDFQLDENFNEVIKSRFRDTFSYTSFSEGEKTKINLSIMMTWRAVSKMRNSIATNLLIMDETLDGSMDVSGVESLISVLSSLAAGDNTYVISHRGDQFGDKFDRHVYFAKERDFSILYE